MKAMHRQTRRVPHIKWDGKMKKLLFPLTILVVFKMACLFLFDTGQEQLPVQKIFDVSSTVSAQEENISTADNMTINDGSAGWNYELIIALKKREDMLREKEDALKKEGERLSAIKREIDVSTEILMKTEKKIAVLIDTMKTEEDEKLRKLAKVFEATPAEQAGPLVSKLDIEIAAKLILKMNSRKAGKTWGFVEPDRAVEISKELIRIKPDFDIGKITSNK